MGFDRFFADRDLYGSRTGYDRAIDFNTANIAVPQRFNSAILLIFQADDRISVDICDVVAVNGEGSAARAYTNTNAAVNARIRAVRGDECYLRVRGHGS